MSRSATSSAARSAASVGPLMSCCVHNSLSMSRALFVRLMGVLFLVAWSQSCNWNVGELDIRLVYAAGADDPFNAQTSVIKTLRISIEGEESGVQRTEFSLGPSRSGTMAEVPVGQTVRVVVEGLDVIGQPRYRGVSSKLEIKDGKNKIFLFFSRVGEFSDPPAVQSAISPDWPEQFRTAMRSGFGRVFHQALVLPDGRVLLVGGTQLSDPSDHLARLGKEQSLRSAEIFDPSSGAFVKNSAHCVDADGDGWGPSPDCLGLDCDDSDPAVHVGCAAGCDDSDGDGYGIGEDCLGSDCKEGDALCAYGACCGECPASGGLCMEAPRAFLSILPLGDGDIWLVVGGEPGGLEHPAEYFSFKSMDFSLAPDELFAPRSRQAAAMVGDRMMIVAGGIGSGGQLLDDVQASSLDVSFSKVGQLSVARSGATVVQYPGGALVIGGWKDFSSDPAQRVASKAIDRFTVQGSDVLIDSPPELVLHEPRSQASAVAFTDAAGRTRVLVCGGLVDPQTATASCELVKPAEGSVDLLQAQGVGMTVPRWRHTATLLPDGTVLIAGGFSQTTAGAARNTAEILDPETGQVVEGPMTMRSNRAGHTATLMPNGMVLLAGGIAGPGTLASPSYEIFNP